MGIRGRFQGARRCGAAPGVTGIPTRGEVAHRRPRLARSGAHRGAHWNRHLCFATFRGCLDPSLSGAAATPVSSMDAAHSVQGPLIALVGNPNCGKTALFNVLTGSRQKVANYAGVTVERKEGTLLTPSGLRIRILDLPGAYSLGPLTPDEQVTADVFLGGGGGGTQPGFLVCVT